MADIREISSLFEPLNYRRIAYFVTGGLAVDVHNGVLSPGRDLVEFYAFQEDVPAEVLRPAKNNAKRTTIQGRIMAAF